MERKIGTVQTVKEKKPEKEIKKPKGYKKVEGRSMSGPLKLPSQTEIMKDPMRYIGQAVQIFQNLAVQVEKQGEAIVEIAKHIKTSDEKLAPIVTALEQAQAARTQAPAGSNPAPPGIPGGMGALLQLLPSLLSGGGVDEETRDFNKRMRDLTLRRMEGDIGFTEAIKDVIVRKIAGKAAADIVGV